MSEDPFIDHMERRCGCYDEPEPEDEDIMERHLRPILEDLHAANERIKQSIARIEQNNRELKAWMEEKGLLSATKAETAWERHDIDTESFRCSCGAPMCFTCCWCSWKCKCEHG